MDEIFQASREIAWFGNYSTNQRYIKFQRPIGPLVLLRWLNVDVHSCRGCHLLALSNVAAAPLQRRPIDQRDQRYTHTHLFHKICSGISGTRHCGTSVLVKPAASAAVIAASRRRWSSPCTALESSSRSEVATAMKAQLKSLQIWGSNLSHFCSGLGHGFLGLKKAGNVYKKQKREKRTCASLVKWCQMPDT